LLPVNPVSAANALEFTITIMWAKADLLMLTGSGIGSCLPFVIVSNSRISFSFHG